MIGIVRRLWLLLLLLGAAAPTVATAAWHPANIPSAQLSVSEKGAFDLRVRFDLLAFVLEATPADATNEAMQALLTSPPADLNRRLSEARARFARQTRLITDQGSAAFEQVAFPTTEEVAQWAKDHPEPVFPLMMTARVRGRLPAHSTTISAAFPETMGSVVLITELPYQEPISEPVEPGKQSRALAIPTAAQISEVASAVARRRAEPTALPPSAAVPPKPVIRQSVTPVQSAKPVPTVKPTPPAKSIVAEPKKPTPAVAAAPVTVPPPAASQVPAIPKPSWRDSFPSFVHMGYVHILPEGLDHILFVIGLFLTSLGWRDLILKITAFTVAHSLTLGLAMFGIVRLPASIVEPLIALSIVYVAVENLVVKSPNRWRLAVVFGFGLIHGLGFASALSDTGLARTNFLAALLGFNLGVELGQITVVGVALLTVGWFRARPDYRRFVVTPASCAIAAIAFVWFVQRLK